MKLSYLFFPTALTGCGILADVTPSPCRQLVKTVCEECNVSDSYSDLTCECVEEGEVGNGRDYFSSKSEAEVYCDNLNLRLERRHVADDEQKSCAQQLNLISKHGDDACEYLGFEGRDYSYIGYYDEYY